MLAFSNDYYGMIFRATQSVELFCAYQRKLNETRIPVISKYILENRDSYVFSALAASIDGEVFF